MLNDDMSDISFIFFFSESPKYYAHCEPCIRAIEASPYRDTFQFVDVKAQKGHRLIKECDITSVPVLVSNKQVWDDTESIVSFVESLGSAQSGPQQIKVMDPDAPESVYFAPERRRDPNKPLKREVPLDKKRVDQLLESANGRAKSRKSMLK